MNQDLFQGRKWCASTKVEGWQLDEIFAWIDANDMDVMCQGVMQGSPEDQDDLEWHSIWSFGNDADLLMFVLRFGG